MTVREHTGAENLVCPAVALGPATRQVVHKRVRRAPLAGTVRGGHCPNLTGYRRSGSVSIGIPTWCEAGEIGRAVDAALAIADEVIVADGGSPDPTAAIASARGARVVVAAKGRGAQLAAGARAATGDVLLFLHADARLPAAARAASTAS